MTISFDPVKRDRTLAERGLDFADAEQVFSGVKFQFVDARKNYGEERVTNIGLLNDRMVVVVWTRRGEGRHIISMRKANQREQGKYGKHLD